MSGATTTATRAARWPRWVTAFLAAVLAVAVGLAGAGSASAVTTSAAQNGVGASTPAAQVFVGLSAGITAGQRLGNDLPRPGIVVATGVAAEAEAPLVWPPNNGFHGDLGPHGNPGVTVLKPGTLVDRFGLDGGRFVAPNGTPIGARSLAPGTTDLPYSVFEVTNRLPVQTGLAEPWFGQPGMGTQYRLPASVSDLLDAGYLRRVN